MFLTPMTRFSNSDWGNTEVLAVLDRVELPVTEETVDAVVNGLTVAFKSIHGKNALSAASKLLWVLCQSPAVIYDSQAASCLRRCGCRFPQSDYGAYRREWLAQFARREKAIQEACCGLRRVKDFSRACAMPDDEFDRLTESRWFHERVFDKFAWSNAGAR
jgi:hypothetical protein